MKPITATLNKKEFKAHNDLTVAALSLNIPQSSGEDIIASISVWNGDAELVGVFYPFTVNVPKGFFSHKVDFTYVGVSNNPTSESSSLRIQVNITDNLIPCLKHWDIR